jgi:glutathione S-transferase
MPVIQIHHSPFSSNARKALLVAKLLGIEFEPIVVDLPGGAQRKPEFLALNPNGVVPVLVHGDVVLPESNAIMAYLCDVTASDAARALYPTALAPRAQVNRWLFWMSNHWSPAIAGLNFEHVLKRMFGQGDADPAQVARHEGFFKRWAAVLDAQLGKTPWVTGEVMTIADLALAAPLMYAQAAKLPLDGFANVQKWHAKIRELPAWRETEMTR